MLLCTNLPRLVYSNLTTVTILSPVYKKKSSIFVKKAINGFCRGFTQAIDNDPEIAHAWERLTNGTFTKNDILLLNHEKLELELMREKGYTYEKAHNEANKKYYWAKEIKKENVGKI